MHNDTVYIFRVSQYDAPVLNSLLQRLLQEVTGENLKGKKMLLKPNLLLARKPGNAATTHPAIVRAAAEAVIGCGGKPLVAESGGGPFTPVLLEKLYTTTGLKDELSDLENILNSDASAALFPFPVGPDKRTISCLGVLPECDGVINLAKLKTHTLMTMTGAVKNLFGLVPGLHKSGLHRCYPDKNAFASAICDIAQGVKPVLSVIDGIIGMEGEGPSGGTPIRSGVIIAGENPFACDLAACEIMGIRPGDVPILREGIRRGLIPARAVELHYPELKPEQVSCHFTVPGQKRSIVSLLPGVLRYPLEDRSRAYPRMDEDCIGCGRCAEICPAGAIYRPAEKKTYRVNIRQCIRCYCCHEICPRKAIRLVRKKDYPHDEKS